jgi:23S rRNA (cytidine1920-2'-O)/16S rRNA (cytidine1409-2'-O)-methyltransferase
MRERRAPRERLDVLLVERGLAPSRGRAQALVLAGRVRSGTQRLDKPGMRLPSDAPLEVVSGPRWVGRGGDKLAAVLPHLGLAIAGRDAIDIGASTGGFTHVLLESGVSRVIALDVGSGQLDWGLRNDPRVVTLEGVNARYLRPGDLPFVPTLAVVDVSFISLVLVLPAILRCLAPDGELLALVNPQFEVGRGGIVRDPGLHRETLRRIVRFLADSGCGVRHVLRCPVPGAEGNVEFFVHARAGGSAPDARSVEAAIDAAVRDADREEPT